MALFFRPDWAWTTPPRCSSIGPSPHQSGDFQVPLKFETFFTSGRNRVTANCGNWSQQPREENTRSIIYTSVPRTRLQNKTWTEQQRGRFTADTQQNEWKKTWICCEVNSSALPGWTLFAHSTNLLWSGWPCPREAEEGESHQFLMRPPSGLWLSQLPLLSSDKHGLDESCFCFLRFFTCLTASMFGSSSAEVTANQFVRDWDTLASDKRFSG